MAGMIDRVQQTILESLTHAVRLMSIQQISSLTDVDGDSALYQVDELEQAGLVSVETHLVGKVDQAGEPLIAWAPGKPSPDFRPAAYRLRSRWREQIEMQLVLPTRKACRLFGGTQVRPREAEWTHDLWMGEVYLAHRRRPSADWRSGDALRAEGRMGLFAGKVPDACLVSGSGEILRVIEGGGRGYNRQKLQSLHAGYSDFAYEIW